MNLNKVLLIGNLTRDPEMRTTQSGQTVTTLAVATNRIWNNQQTGQKEQQVEYHSVICWGRLGELAGQYLAKGRSVFVEGRLATRSWQDAKTGEKRYRTEIIAENVQFGPRPATTASGYQPSAGSTPPEHNQQTGGFVSGRDKAEDGEQSGSPVAENLPVIQEDEPEIEVKDIPF